MAAYLRTFRLQRTATEGAQPAPQDRRLGEAILTAAAKGVIDADTLDRQIAPLFTDQGRIAPSEAGLMDVLNSAQDSRRAAKINGVRVRLDRGAKARLQHHQAALVGQLPPAPGLTEAQFQRAAVTSTQAWYQRATADAYADLEANDPELFDAAARGRDLASAARIGFGGLDEGALYGLLPGRPEDEDFYRARAFFTPAGDPVPRDQVRLMRLNHEPEYAGQVLTSLLAFDRRDGAVLAHLWTND
jgi:hypothetical protein